MGSLFKYLKAFSYLVRLSQSATRTLSKIKLLGTQSLLFCGSFDYFPQATTSNMGDKAPLNNNPTMRGVSDKLDKALKWGGYDDPNQSKTRATAHAAYHEIQHLKTGNPREHERAKDQWGVVTGGPTDNLKNYDAKNAKK